MNDVSCGDQSFDPGVVRRTVFDGMDPKLGNRLFGVCADGSVWRMFF